MRTGRTEGKKLYKPNIHIIGLKVLKAQDQTNPKVQGRQVSAQVAKNLAEK